MSEHFARVDSERTASGPRPRRVKLPAFVKHELGLGDAIGKLTSYVGIKPCGGCRQRAEALNQRVVFAPRHTQ